jgi:NAD(P)-dependent dehydrogenase (short-subunit alcohol dehydrogenase family)
VLLENKVAIISGVGPGISRSTALTLAREGADVALGARSDETMRGVAAEVEALGRRAIHVSTDITDRDQCRRLAAEAHSAFGRIDILVNNAATSRPMTPLMDSDLDDWRTAMDINFWGSLNMTQAVVPYMRELGDGRVIMISSAAAFTSVAGFGPYASSKAALRAVSRVLARELGPFGIRVNTVAPGATEGANFAKYCEELAAKRNVDPQVIRDEVAADYALQYIPGPDEVAGGVLYFASELGRASTGQFLLVNGGQVFE